MDARHILLIFISIALIILVNVSTLSKLSLVSTVQTKENLVSVLTLNKIIKAIEITENMRISTLKNKSVKLTLVKFCACFKAVLGR